ncbi:MAG: Rrf2 family transcriptional regulator [Gammaproteobacteria bacterium]|nr:Rrf2 family transcriptional regulator [Gammaproteobacteria bacterium]
MQLTKFTDYSLRCLIYLAHKENEFTSIKTISEHYNISYEHLTKIIHNLSVLGYIESKKGKNGGVKLANNVNKLRIGDLIKTLEPNMNLVECFDHETNTCKITDSCRLKHYFWGANKAFIDFLNQYTLKDAIF